jgi:hypothetical protein
MALFLRGRELSTEDLYPEAGFPLGSRGESGWVEACRS